MSVEVLGAGFEGAEGLLLEDAGVVNGFVALFPKKLETADALDAGVGLVFELLAEDVDELAGEPTAGFAPSNPEDAASPETAGLEEVIAGAGLAGVTVRVLDFEMTTSWF